MRNIPLVVWIVLTPFVIAFCDEPDQAKKQADQRLAYMRRMIAAMVVKPDDRESKLATDFNPNAILRFGDLARDTNDGALWKLGAGRPQAIVATEFVLKDNQTLLCYEFLSLTKERFVLRTNRGWNWTPATPGMQFTPFESTRPPHKSEVIRLIQMKELARRFTVNETLNGKPQGLRLLPQPIDHYLIDGRVTNQKGAVFVFAHGTNPEVLLLIEPIDDGWQYGLARMTGAAATVTLGKQVVWTKPPIEQVGKSWQLDYTGEAHVCELSESGE